MDLVRQYSIDKEKIAYRVINDKAVVLNLDNGHYYCLNDTGTRILELINKKTPLLEILDFLKKEYEIQDERLKDDLIELVKDLVKERIII
jgi:hypothetical protein